MNTELSPDPCQSVLSNPHNTLSHPRQKISYSKSSHKKKNKKKKNSGTVQCMGVGSKFYSALNQHVHVHVRVATCRYNTIVAGLQHSTDSRVLQCFLQSGL